VQTVASEMGTLGGVAKVLMSAIGNPSIGLTGNNGKPLTFPFAYANTGSVNVIDRPQSLVSYLANFKGVTDAAVADPTSTCPRPSGQRSRSWPRQWPRPVR
jgi:hypothetical protein